MSFALAGALFSVGSSMLSARKNKKAQKRRNAELRNIANLGYNLGLQRIEEEKKVQMQEVARNVNVSYQSGLEGSGRLIDYQTTQQDKINQMSKQQLELEKQQILAGQTPTQSNLDIALGGISAGMGTFINLGGATTLGKQEQQGGILNQTAVGQASPLATPNRISDVRWADGTITLPKRQQKQSLFSVL